MSQDDQQPTGWGQPNPQQPTTPPTTPQITPPAMPPATTPSMPQPVPAEPIQTGAPRFDPQTGQPLAPSQMHPQGQPMGYAMPATMHGMNLPHQQMMWFEANKKSMAVAYLLNIFVGWIGVHRFYVGRNGSGLALCLVGGIGFLLTCIYIGILALMVACVWSIVDLFLTHGYVTQYNNQLLYQLQQSQPQQQPTASYGQQ